MNKIGRDVAPKAQPGSDGGPGGSQTFGSQGPFTLLKIIKAPKSFCLCGL